jgi:cell division protease FtsH
MIDVRINHLARTDTGEHRRVILHITGGQVKEQAMKDKFPKNEDQNSKNRSKVSWKLTEGVKNIAVLFFILLVIGFTISLISPRQSTAQTISYTQFRQQVEEGRVEQLVFSEDSIKGKFTPPLVEESSTGEEYQIESFVTYLPPIADEGLFPLLQEKGVTILTEPPSASWWSILLYALPILLLIWFGFQLMRRMGSQGDGVTSMLKTQSKVYDTNSQVVTFQDVAGAFSAKQELQEIIEFLKKPEQYLHLGANIPKGVLLVGPPGTGKTLMARAVAGEAEVPFIPTSGSDFMEMFVGVGASRVRGLFNQAKQNAPAIIFIDELDSIGRKRGFGIGGGHDEREQTLNQVLAEMDGFEKTENVIVMAATNRPDILDPALLRPGRFDRQVTIDSPTYSERVEILKVHARRKPLAADVDFEQIARSTPGFSGADLANLLNEAALLAIRHGKNEISSQEISEASDKILMGLERNLVLTEEETRLLAYHEAGHAVVAAILPHADPIHKVTIIPRGRAMGVTQQMPERDRYLFHRDYMLDRMAVMMGGRAAEELALNIMTSGAADDLKQATYLARKMVLEWGMSERLGHIALGTTTQTFLGEETSSSREYSEATAQLADREISQLLEEAFQRAKEILTEHRPGLDRVVKALLEKEQIFGSELVVLLGLEKTEISPIYKQVK